MAVFLQVYGKSKVGISGGGNRGLSLPSRFCKTQPHTIPQYAKFAHAEFAPSEFRAASRARQGKAFDLCKMGVYLGVYQHNMKIKYLINNALNHQFKSHCHHQTKTAQISGLFFMSNATNVPS